MTLIVVSQLTTKEGLYFRYLTSAMKLHYNMDVIVEAQAAQIDYYYSLLKKRGLYDFVSEIVTPEMREEGIRLDTEMNYPLTVTTQKINVINVSGLIASINNLCQIKNNFN
jgi:hypothetical protein